MAEDPFYLVRQDVEATAGDLQAALTKWRTILSNADEPLGDVDVARQQVDRLAQALSSQLRAVTAAIDRSSADPARFHLTPDEVALRRRWLDEQNAAQKAAVAALADPAATALYMAKQRKEVGVVGGHSVLSPGAGGSVPPPLGSGGRTPRAARDAAGGGHRDRTDAGQYTSSDAEYRRLEEDSVRRNHDVMTDEFQQQAAYERQQDEDVEDLTAAVRRIGRQATLIGDEIKEQNALVGALEGAVEATQIKLREMNRRVDKVVRMMGDTGGMVCIVVLVLIILGLVAAVIFV
eukprot:TRINITY_DN7185_c0_g1_i1.p1 TRINITY_DN7185_c0_g1~~TRINITY_DN7185_c0_g1_i1.p1  ORF type:complete len:292 (+),score=61.95 TRINITY_DN7185_c0_g1_i1:232-1107(+)